MTKTPFRRKSTKVTRKAMQRAAERRGPDSFIKPKAEKKKNPILFISMIMILLAGLGVTTFYLIDYFTKQKPAAEEGMPDLGEDLTAAGFDFVTDKENRKILHLKPTFAVNLSGLEGRRIIIVTIWLEVNNLDVAREFNDDIAKYRRVNDDIIRTLMSWTYAELIYGNGMERLKNQLKVRINQYVKTGKVVNVFFRDVQFKYLLPSAEPIPN